MMTAEAALFSENFLWPSDLKHSSSQLYRDTKYDWPPYIQSVLLERLLRLIQIQMKALKEQAFW